MLSLLARGYIDWAQCVQTWMSLRLLVNQLTGDGIADDFGVCKAKGSFNVKSSDLFRMSCPVGGGLL